MVIGIKDVLSWVFAAVAVVLVWLLKPLIPVYEKMFLEKVEEEEDV